MQKNRTREEICQSLAQALLDYLELMAQPAPDPDSTRLYTYDDLAQMLGKSKSTVRQWVCAGEFGEPVTVGSSTRVTQAGVDKFIADHSGPTKKQPSKTRKHTGKMPATYKGPPLGI